MRDVAFKPSMTAHGAAGEALRIPSRDVTVHSGAVDCWVIYLREHADIRYQLMCVRGGEPGVYVVALWQTDVSMASDLEAAGLDHDMASIPRDMVALELPSDAMGRYVTRAIANMVARGVIAIHEGHQGCEHWCQAVELVAALKAWETSGLT